MNKDEDKKGTGLGLGSTPQKAQSDAESEMLKQQVMSNRQALLNNLSANQPGNPRASMINQPALTAESQPQPEPLPESEVRQTPQEPPEQEPVPEQLAMPRVFDSILETLKVNCVEANKSLASTDLELHCESPTHMQERVSSKDGMTYRFLRGHISLPNYSLVIDATERKIEVFIVPSEFVLGFDPDSHLFQPHLLIEFGSLGQNGWFIGNTMIGPSMLPEISRQLLRNLIGVARGEIDPKQPFGQAESPKIEEPPAPRDESQPQLPAVAPRGNLPSLLSSEQPQAEDENLIRSEKIKTMMSRALSQPDREPVVLFKGMSSVETPSNGGDSGNLGLKGLLGDSAGMAPSPEPSPQTPRLASLKDTNEFARLSQLIAQENEARNNQHKEAQDPAQSSGSWQRADEGAMPGEIPPVTPPPQNPPQLPRNNSGMPLPPGMQRPQTADSPSPAPPTPPAAFIPPAPTPPPAPPAPPEPVDSLPEASGAFARPDIEPPPPPPLAPSNQEPPQAEPTIQPVPTSSSQQEEEPTQAHTVLEAPATQPPLPTTGQEVFQPLETPEEPSAEMPEPEAIGEPPAGAFETSELPQIPLNAYLNPQVDDTQPNIEPAPTPLAETPQPPLPEPVLTPHPEAPTPEPAFPAQAEAEAEAEAPPQPPLPQPVLTPAPEAPEPESASASQPPRPLAQLFGSDDDDDDFEEESNKAESPQNVDSDVQAGSDSEPYGASLGDLEKSLSMAAEANTNQPNEKEKVTGGLGSIVDKTTDYKKSKPEVNPEDVKPVISGISRPRNTLSSLLIPEEDEETVDSPQADLEIDSQIADSKDLGVVVSQTEKHLTDGCSQLLSYVDKALASLKTIGVEAMQNDNLEAVNEIMNQTKRLKALREKLANLKDDIK